MENKIVATSKDVQLSGFGKSLIESAIQEYFFIFGDANPVDTNKVAQILTYYVFGIEDLNNRFIYHAPTEKKLQKYGEIRVWALGFSDFLNLTCPDSREKSLAITALEEAVMWANASIARNE